MLSDMQRLTRAFLAQRGFSVGMGDCVVGAADRERVRERVLQATRVADEITQEVARGECRSEEGAVAEATIRRVLSKALTQAGAIVERALSDDNAIKCMVACGSKGSTINISQIGGRVGQQSVEGRRLVAEKGSRTLPSCEFGDTSLQSRGFVDSSYAQGLDATEFFFHCMAGREGLVDTAVKTSQTGYLQRRQVKAMESHRVHADGSVRNGSGDIVQFSYGDLGMDPARIERVELSALRLSEADVRARLGAPARPTPSSRCAIAFCAAFRRLAPTRTCLPFHRGRAARRFLRTRARPSSATRAAYAAVLEELAACPVLELCWRAEVPEERGARHPVEELERLRAFAADALAEARVASGEMVGCIAAQSIGEPTTQMTLEQRRLEHDDGHPLDQRQAAARARRGRGRRIRRRAHRRATARRANAPDGVTVYLPLPPGSAVALSPDADGRDEVDRARGRHRHPPINRDGSNTLVEVTTESGRTVVVTKGKSLLVERRGKLVEADGDAVKIGDRVPVVHTLPAADGSTTLDLRSVFLPTEVVFTDVMIEAMGRRGRDEQPLVREGRLPLPLAATAAPR